jgi:hypothetical protein
MLIEKEFTDNWLQPTGAQERLLHQYAGCKRLVWNRALSIERAKAPPTQTLGKAHLDVGSVFQVHRVDEADLALIESQNHGRGAHAFAEETNAF